MSKRSIGQLELNTARKAFGDNLARALIFRFLELIRLLWSVSYPIELAQIEPLQYC